MSMSIPIQQGWKLRVLSGTSIGQEFNLQQCRYVLGSQPGADIVIPLTGIAPRHVIINVCSDHVRVDDCSGGRGMEVNGRRVYSARLAPGDPVTVAGFSFEFRNPAVAIAKAPRGGTAPVLAWLQQLALWQRVGIITFAIATALYILLATTQVITLVPVTLLAMSAVVPATVLSYIVPTYDKTGISFQTLTITFLLGATVGVICAVIGIETGALLGGAMAVAPIFAGIYEEPAKLLGTAWRWRHPTYDRPMDGLILGTVSGLGFAVAETAGYGLATMVNKDGSMSSLLYLMVIRGIGSPFAHGLWSGILAAAFWQCGRDLKRAFKSRVFGIAALWAVGMHALWNSSSLFAGAPQPSQEGPGGPSQALWAAGHGPGGLGYGCMVLSGLLSLREYRRLLQRNGYRT
jgi:RsiW-degrading membrane proteinase PrsW (M82 family)